MEELCQEALERLEETRGSENEDIACLVNDLADLKREQGVSFEARDLLQRAVETMVEASEPKYPDVANLLKNYAAAEQALGHYENAESRAARALQIMEALVDKDGEPRPGAGEIDDHTKTALRPIYEQSLMSESARING